MAFQLSLFKLLALLLAIGFTSAIPVASTTASTAVLATDIPNGPPPHPSATGAVNFSKWLQNYEARHSQYKPGPWKPLATTSAITHWSTNSTAYPPHGAKRDVVVPDVKSTSTSTYTPTAATVIPDGPPPSAAGPGPWKPIPTGAAITHWPTNSTAHPPPGSNKAVHIGPSAGKRDAVDPQKTKTVSAAGPVKTGNHDDSPRGSGLNATAWALHYNNRHGQYKPRSWAAGNATFTYVPLINSTAKPPTHSMRAVLPLVDGSV